LPQLQVLGERPQEFYNGFSHTGENTPQFEMQKKNPTFEVVNSDQDWKKIKK